MNRGLAFTCLEIAVIFASITVTVSTAEEPPCALEKEMAEAMGKEALGAPSELSQLIRSHGDAVLPFLYPYLESDKRLVKHAATRGIARILQESEDNNLRQRIVLALLPHIDSSICSILTALAPADYSVDSRKYIHERILSLRQEREGNDVRLGFYILVAGVAHMSDELPLLAEIVAASEDCLESTAGLRRFETVGWEALRARARMGIREDALRVIDIVDSCDSEITKLMKCEELVYIRRPEVVQYLWNYLNRDDAPASLGKDTVQRSYAVWGADALSQMLKEFPKYTSYTVVDNKKYATVYINEIQELRRWMAEQKEWHFK